MSQRPPVFLLLEEAAEKYDIPPRVVLDAATRGLVRAARINGHLAVAESDGHRLSQERPPETV